VSQKVIDRVKRGRPPPPKVVVYTSQPFLHLFRIP